MRFYTKRKVIVKPDVPENEDAPFDKKKNFLEWDSNIGRRQRVLAFRRNAFLDEDVEITEDVINKHEEAFNGTCLASGKTKDRLRAELLRKPWTGLENYNWW